jgi:tRNA G18 (ribose-2'-O)-methylase SpoU
MGYNMFYMEDTRNILDEYKGMTNEQIFDELNKKRNELEVAIENVSHDFNIGTIVRSANSFNVSKVHIVGKKKYNRRGAMCTDKYLEIIHWDNYKEFVQDQKKRGREIVAIENNTSRAKKLSDKVFIQKTTLVFGSEGEGITGELLDAADDVRFIESFGSTRSVNVGVAGGIAMYEWVKQCVINKKISRTVI